MPAKNSIKHFIENSYYHLYNRGVEKRIIFLDEQDYAVFFSYLKIYLLPKDAIGLQNILLSEEVGWAQKEQARKLLRLNNFSDTLSLVAFCLMPNHFHFLVKQTEINTIDRFMNSLCTRYSMYFNKKYHRVGPLFQGLYKAVYVHSDEQLLYLTRYIHRNPVDLYSQGSALRIYAYSSYSRYLGITKEGWIKPDDVLAFFGSKGKFSYESFVEGQEFIEAQEHISSLLIDGEDMDSQGSALRITN